MVPIALKSAVVDRWQVSSADAHWFAGIALLGAVAAVFMLRLLERRSSPARTIAVASIVNAVALCTLAAPVGFEPALGLRFLTGAMDMVTLAVLLGLLESGDSDRAGRRYGPAALAIMLGLAAGFVIGGILAKGLGSNIFLVGASLSILLAVAAGCTGGLLKSEFTVTAKSSQAVRYWPALLFSFSDRALSAVLSVTGTLYLVDELGLGEKFIGGALGLVLVIIGLGAWPAGVLSDRVGPLPVRIAAVLTYATAFALLAASPWMSPVAIAFVLLLMGIGGAGLAPSMFVLASRKGRGALDMGGIHASGSGGYFIGMLTAGGLLLMRPQFGAGSTFQVIFLTFATAYLLLNLLAIAAMAGWRVPTRGGLSEL
ncbi:MAG: hypothetical protein MK101_09225 [Phycisphaerales bacterium]|nr:hypothetical protein [Phycisphaerales bacterium]